MSFKKINMKRIVGTVVILGITILGVKLIISSHALSAYTTISASSGTLTCQPPLILDTL